MLRARGATSLARPSLAIAAGLAVQAASTYVTLILAARLLGQEGFAGIAVLYMLLTAVATGLLLPLEQEITRRLGTARGRGVTDATLVLEAVAATAFIAAVLTAAGLAFRAPLTELLGGSGGLLAALLMGLAGYAVCFLSRGHLAGQGSFRRYGLQLAVEGVFRLGCLVAFMASDVRSVVAIGYAFALAPWVAVLTTQNRTRVGQLVASDTAAKGMSRPLCWLLVSGLSSQLVMNSAPLLVAAFVGSGDQADPGALLAALLLVRVPVLLSTALQPRFLGGLSYLMGRGDVGAIRREITRTALVWGLAGALNGAFWLLAGPTAVALVFALPLDHARLSFALLGVGVGAILVATVFSQALVARQAHRRNALGWLAGLLLTPVALALPGSPYDQALGGFLAAAAGACVVHAIALRLAA